MSTVCPDCCPGGIHAAEPAYWCRHGMLVSQAASRRLTEQDAARYRFIRDRLAQGKWPIPRSGDQYWEIRLDGWYQTFDEGVDAMIERYAEEQLFDDDCRTDKRDVAEIIDSRVRPLVELLRECRPYIDDYQGTLPPGDPSGTTLARIDAALKDAGAE